MGTQYFGPSANKMVNGLPWSPCGHVQGGGGGRSRARNMCTGLR